ncbi:MAG: hypothetical protein M3O90_00710 [Actinomycetota bacterium]|nr:hypothetical protein [Actinomycetota bacterium]
MGLAMVVVALVLPASAAAAYPYTTTVERNKCVTTGGLYGTGFVRLKVLQKEWGVSGTNYFKVRIQVQHRPRGTSTWSVVDSMTNVSESFPNDANNWWWEQNRRYDFTGYELLTYEHRIAMRFQWWDLRAGPDVLLSQKTVHSHTC